MPTPWQERSAPLHLSARRAMCFCCPRSSGNGFPPSAKHGHSHGMSVSSCSPLVSVCPAPAIPCVPPVARDTRSVASVAQRAATMAACRGAGESWLPRLPCGQPCRVFADALPPWLGGGAVHVHHAPPSSSRAGTSTTGPILWATRQRIAATSARDSCQPNARFPVTPASHVQACQ